MTKLTGATPYIEVFDMNASPAFYREPLAAEGGPRGDGQKISRLEVRFAKSSFLV